MSLGTVDRTPPSLFQQGPSALSKCLVLSALALLLMVVDARLQWAGPIRSTLAVALYPLQWLALQPVRLVHNVRDHLDSLEAAQRDAQAARQELTRQAQRAALVEHLTLENQELRQLLQMRDRLPVTARGAEVLFDDADPYTQRLVLDRGLLQGVRAGSPVMDGYGVLGQVTRVYPTTAEVTLLVDRDQAIPVLNTRTGLRSLAYGLPGADPGMELRFVPQNADIEVGDILTTSGVDGIYPPGLPVAKVQSVARQTDSGFARIQAEPLGRMQQVLQVLVLDPVQAATKDAP